MWRMNGRVVSLALKPGTKEKQQQVGRFLIWGYVCGWVGGVAAHQLSCGWSAEGLERGVSLGEWMSACLAASVHV